MASLPNPPEARETASAGRQAMAVAIVRLSLAATAAEVEQLAGLLSTAERERAGRRLPEVRRRAVVSRGRLRQLLGWLLDAPPGAVELTTGPQGKPALAGPFAGLLEFNLSHSGDEGLVAVSRHGPLGIDLELGKPNQTPDWARLMAGTIFSPPELARWRQLPELQRAAAVLDAWVAKEAVFKALGTGIGDRLRQCMLPAELPRLPVDAGRSPPASRLIQPQLPAASDPGGEPLGFTLLGLQPGYHAALACRARAVQLTVSRFDEVFAGDPGLLSGPAAAAARPPE